MPFINHAVEVYVLFGLWLSYGYLWLSLAIFGNLGSFWLFTFTSTFHSHFLLFFSLSPSPPPPPPPPHSFHLTFSLSFLVPFCLPSSVRQGFTGYNVDWEPHLPASPQDAADYANFLDLVRLPP